MRALHPLLAAVLAVAVVAVPIGATTAAPSPAPPERAVPPPGPAPQVDEGPTLDGPVEVLSLADGVENRSTTAETTLDVGPAVSVAANESSHELLTRQSLARVRDADDPDAALADELARLEARADALGRSQRAALGAFSVGEADARATLLRLVQIDRTARALDDRRTSVVAAARARDADVPTDRSGALGRELDIYTGPVRAQLAAALRGEVPPTRAYLSTTPRGVTLATVTESGYVRETYRGELRRTGGAPLNRTTAREAVARAYPSIWAARRAVDARGAGVSRVRVTYDGGELAATVGSGNDRVFRDVHRQSLGVAGTDAAAINTRDGLRMIVNRSYAGGPMRIRVETVDGDPVNASVTVGPEGGDSVPVGATGPDGEHWTLTPAERFTIVAIRGQSVVFITMDPVEAPRTTDG
jgi:hypothetical protein